MLKFALVMLIPLWISVYTASFGRWMKRRRGSTLGAMSAYLLSLLSLAASGTVLWRMFT